MKVALIRLYLLVLWIVLPVDAPGPRQLCDKPDFPGAYYNGVMVAAAPGTSLTLTCKEGYKTGYPTTTCRDGQWTTPTPPCELVKCQHEDLDTPHVLVDYDCLHVDCVATLTCLEGYWYNGPKTKICQQDGTWSGPIVNCQVVQCEKLTPPQYGWIQQNNRGYLAVTTVYCDEGYTYSHPNSISRQCQANNTWSGQDGTCIVEPCPELAAVDNGVLSESSGTVTLYCNDGYTLNGASIIYCKPGGEWSADIGNCEGETNLTGLWALVFVPLLLFALGFFGYRYWKNRQKNHTTETRENDVDIALLPGVSPPSEMYVYITVSDSFGSIYVDEGSSEYTDFKESMERQVLRELVQRNKSKTKIEILDLRKPNGISLRITCQEPIAQEAVCAALKGLTIPIVLQGTPDTYNFVCESANTGDPVTADLKLQILRGKHIPDNDNDFEIDLESQYVDLRVIRPTGVLSLHKFSHEAWRRWKDHGEDISDEEIIKDEKGMILLLGRAGVGKSTLMQKLARKWANSWTAVHLKAVFFLNLHFLISDKKKMTFASLVSMRPTYINVDNIVRVDDEWLKTNQALIAIMLDGLDEIGKMRRLWERTENGDTMDTPLGWCLRLLKRQHLPESTLLLSTRSPKGVCSLIEPTEVVEVMGLPDSHITTFIKKNVKDERHREKVERSLSGSAILRSISSITFYCAALCKLLQDNETLAEELVTYTRITAYLLEMYICRSSRDGHTQEDIYEEMGTSLQVMSQLASNGLMNSSLEANWFKECYHDDDIKAAGIDNHMKAKLQKAGLLLWIEAQDAADSDIGQFVHLSIQQYMAMAKLLTFNPGEIKATLKTLLSSSSQFNMALLYLVGLAFNDEENATSRTARAIGVPAQDHKVIREALTKAAVELAATPTIATDAHSDLAPDHVIAIQMVHESQSPEFAREVGEEGFRHRVKLENIKLTLMEIKGLTFLLRNCSSITKLELKHVAPDLSSVQEISQFLEENKSIKEASLVGNTIDGSAIKELLLAVKKNRHLEKLEMSFSRQIRDDMMTFVADALLVNTTLKELWLVGGILGNCDVLAMHQLLQESNIQIRMSKYTHDESAGQELQHFIEKGTLVFEEGMVT